MGEFTFEKVSHRVKTNSMLINVVLALLAAANFLNMLAFTTTAWGRVYSISGGGFFGFGLWRICSSGTQSFSAGSLCTDTTGWPQDWYGASQTLAIFGFLGIVGGLIMLMLFLCLKQCKGNTSFLFGTALYILITGIIYFIGIVIFGVTFDTLYGAFVSGFGSLASLSWSFGVALVADILSLTAGVLLAIEARRGRYTSPRREKHSKSSSKHGHKKQSSIRGKQGNKKVSDKPTTTHEPECAKTQSSHTPVEVSAPPASTTDANFDIESFSTTPPLCSS